MLTGDNGETARQIGMSCGILKSTEKAGSILEITSEKDLKQLIETSKSQKNL